MSNSQVIRLSGTAIPLLLDDIDTDRIIPARYLRCVTFDGLGEHVFEDDRQQDPGQPFNSDRFAGASVLVAGRNFGCGSSREHAPQALMRWGLQAIVAESFAEIFFGNCTALGIPTMTLGREQLESLSSAVEADPTIDVTVDLEAVTVAWGDVTAEAGLPESARTALVSGEWDFLSQLLANDAAIGQTAGVIPYLNGFGSA